MINDQTDDGFDPDDLGLDNDETAKILGKKPNTLATWRSKGKGPRFRRSTLESSTPAPSSTNSKQPPFVLLNRQPCAVVVVRWRRRLPNENAAVLVKRKPAAFLFLDP